MLLLDSLQSALALLLLVVVLYHVVPYYIDPYQLKSYPGPFFARFTDLWLAYHARRGKRSAIVHELHRKYGTVVRLGPNFISIADPDALQVVYGHSTGTLKSQFYDAFVSIQRGLFNTRDRAEHTRKRKIVSHVFSASYVKEFEPFIASNLNLFIKKWDKMCDQAPKGSFSKAFDALPWFNYLSFDVIGDLAFGAPFRMIEREADVAEVEDEDHNVVLLPAIKILNERGEYSATQGVIMPWLRPYMQYLDPWFKRGLTSVRHLAGIARHRVNLRLKEGAGDRKDLLARLQEGRDSAGNPMQVPELTAEALTQLIAGSDTTSNSSCAISFWLAKNPAVQARLVKELQDNVSLDDHPVLAYDQVKALPYLEACINEALRLHSTSAIGLPRVMVEDTVFQGHAFPKGSILSVPTYTIHRSRKHFGSDSDAYRPERWLSPKDAELREKALNIFSFGPRACVGKNLAVTQLYIFIATLFARYEITLADPAQIELDTAEGFLRKPIEAWFRIRRRTL